MTSVCLVFVQPPPHIKVLLFWDVLFGWVPFCLVLFLLLLFEILSFLKLRSCLQVSIIFLLFSLVLIFVTTSGLLLLFINKFLNNKEKLKQEFVLFQYSVYKFIIMQVSREDLKWLLPSCAWLRTRIKHILENYVHTLAMCMFSYVYIFNIFFHTSRFVLRISALNKWRMRLRSEGLLFQKLLMIKEILQRWYLTPFLSLLHLIFFFVLSCLLMSLLVHANVT